jgi:aspartyl protease family protein
MSNQFLYAIIASLVCAGAIKVVDSDLLQKLRPQSEENVPHAAAATYDIPDYSPDTVRIPISSDGQFHASIRINRQDVRFLIDTGASILTLRESDARKVGLHVTPADFTQPVNTANGQIFAAEKQVRFVEFDKIRLQDQTVFILPDDRLGTNLLGMNILSQIGRIEINSSELIITPFG